MSRVLAVAVLATQSTPPPGVGVIAYREAMLADTLDVVDDLAGVVAVLALPPGVTTAVAWPGLPVLAATGLVTVFDGLAGLGATIGAVLAGDAPDLPGLLVGKLLGACEDRPAGACPAAGGGLVGLATRLPAPDWLAADLTFDATLERLHEVAPRGAVTIVGGWHRLRRPADVARLDPGLEGWPRTRALLSGH